MGLKQINLDGEIVPTHNKNPKGCSILKNYEN